MCQIYFDMLLLLDNSSWGQSCKRIWPTVYKTYCLKKDCLRQTDWQIKSRRNRKTKNQKGAKLCNCGRVFFSLDWPTLTSLGLSAYWDKYTGWLGNSNVQRNQSEFKWLHNKLISNKTNRCSLSFPDLTIDTTNMQCLWGVYRGLICTRKNVEGFYDTAPSPLCHRL